MDAVGGGVGLVGLVEGDLGEELTVAPPGGAQSLEDGPVGEGRRRRLPVEAVDRHLLGVGRGPRGQVEGAGGLGRGEDARGMRVHGSSAGASAGRACRARVRRPVPSAASTASWSWTAPCSARVSGASMASSSTVSQPTSEAARRASSTKAVPGSRTVSMTVWSASQGWLDRARRPVRSRPSEAGGEHGGAEQRVVGGLQSGGQHVLDGQSDVEPVALALEGVGGQVDAPGAGGGEVRLPVGGDAVDVGPGEGAGERLGLGAALAQEGQAEGGPGESPASSGRQSWTSADKVASGQSST
ncbi:hypothetical protein SLAVM298S_00013 [Streptomyces lavendulae subsp. lavendulae]